jgi:hypothetical protein
MACGSNMQVLQHKQQQQSAVHMATLGTDSVGLLLQSAMM